MAQDNLPESLKAYRDSQAIADKFAQPIPETRAGADLADVYRR